MMAHLTNLVVLLLLFLSFAGPGCGVPSPLPLPALAPFAISEALKYLHYSNAAYCSIAELSAWNCTPCRRAAGPITSATVIHNKTTGTQGYVVGAPGQVVVAFKGTTILLNWMYDLTFRKVAMYPLCDGCLVHAGFWESWTSVRAAILTTVLDHLAADPKARLVVTGHSLGAALAVLCVMELYYLYDIPASALYTYGLPRVGNDMFVKHFVRINQPSWRLTHWRDPVPHLPVRAMGFEHITQEVFYNWDSSNYTICSTRVNEDPSGSDRFDLTVQVGDHLRYLGIPTGTASCDPQNITFEAPSPAARERLERRFDEIGRDRDPGGRRDHERKREVQ